MYSKKELPQAIETEIKAAKAHFEAEGQSIINGMIPCVFIQKASARRYHVGWRFTKVGTAIGDVQEDCHAAYDKRQEIVWVYDLPQDVKEKAILELWPEEIKVKVSGAMETFTRMGGVGHFPYDCIAKDKYPDAVCYVNEAGGWFGSYNLVEVEKGLYEYRPKSWV